MPPHPILLVVLWIRGSIILNFGSTDPGGPINYEFGSYLDIFVASEKIFSNTLVKLIRNIELIYLIRNRARICNSEFMDPVPDPGGKLITGPHSVYWNFGVGMDPFQIPPFFKEERVKFRHVLSFLLPNYPLGSVTSLNLNHTGTSLVSNLIS